MSNPTAPPKTLIEILDSLTFEVIKWRYGASSAETIAEQLKAAQSIQALALREALEIVDKMGKDPMPRIGRSGKYIKNPQSFQDGFEEARVEFWRVINDHYEGE